MTALDVRIVATLLAACRAPPEDPYIADGAAPLSTRVLASVILAQSARGRSRLLRTAAVAAATELPECAVVLVECGRASAAASFAVPQPPPRARWLVCGNHASSLASVSEALAAAPMFTAAHAVVAAARASTPPRPCAVLVDDIDLLDSGALGGQAALASLCGVWLCPACVAIQENDEEVETASSAVMSASGCPGSVGVLLTAASLALVSRAAFSLPATALVGAMMESPSITNDFLPVLRAAGVRAALAAAGEPARAQLARAAARAALDPELAAIESRLAPPRACAPVDVVCELLPISGIRASAVVIRSGEVADTDLGALRSAVFLPPDESGEDAGTGDAVPAWARPWPIVAPAEAPCTTATVPAPERPNAAASWSSALLGCAAVKADLYRSIVLPLLAWQVRQAGGRSNGAPADVLAASAAMASMRVAPPSGLLLHGPPGCGKTSAAVAIARVCRMRLLVVDAALILAKYVGDSEASLRALFRTARRASPCCLAIENFHVVGGSREAAGGGERGAASVHDRLLATLLTELDGVGIKREEARGGGAASAAAAAHGREDGDADGSSPVVLTIGITEREDDIDAALLRPGRLGVRVAMLPPGPDDRGDLLVSFADTVGAAATPADLRRRASAPALSGISGAELLLWARRAADAAEREGIAGAAASVAHFDATAPAARFPPPIEAAFASLSLAPVHNN